MMSFFNNYQGEIDRESTADQSIPKIEQDFRASSETICDEKDAGGAMEEVRAYSPMEAVIAVDSRASLDISPDSSTIPSGDGGFSEKRNELEHKASEEFQVMEGRCEIEVSEDSMDFFVVESSEKQVLSFGDVGVEQQQAKEKGFDVGVVETSVEQQQAKEKGFDVGVVETSVEHELSTHSYDSPSLDSSDLLSDTGSWMHGFEKGDMVWGKVKSHPWWPGLIFDESFASYSVRKTKREGHVLVAFYGDCSYGWFDPAELLPFDSYYAEKSKQTGSRNFVKALEEAVGEASRRRSLGLTCRCRNKFNFRQTSVPGYFSVDLVNSEFGGVYSTRQIKKARDGLVPSNMISFLKQLALTHKDAERGSMDWISNMAMLLSLRKATFEEFDETYAQAFGVEPLRPSRDAVEPPEQPLNLANRAAPLSGRLVIAEVLGAKRKTSGKSAVKASSKDKAKKDKYLFKRRDDAPQSIAHGLSSVPSESPSLGGFRPPVVVASVSEPTDLRQMQGNASVYFDSVPQGQDTASVFGKPVGGLPADDHVLQKRQPADDRVGLLETFRTGPFGDVSTKVEAVVVEMKVDTPVFAGDGQIDTKQEVKAGIGVTIGMGSFNQNPSVMGVGQMIGDRMPTAGVVVKKEEKRQRKENGGQGMPDAGTKKKRKKKDAAVESVLDHPSLKPSKVGKQGDVEQIGIPLRDSARSELSKTDIGPGGPLGISDVAITLPPFDFKPQELDIRLLSNDLSALALDPFHGSDRNASVIVRHFFLRFRNLIYQKSLVPPPANESDIFQIQSKKSEFPSVRQVAGVGFPEATYQGEARGPTQASKKVKPAIKAAVRIDDPMKTGRKRAPSDRQEQILVKKVKKINQLKELASEKKAGGTQKPPEGNAQEDAKGATSLSVKGSKADLPKKQDLSTTTTLVSKKKETVKKQEEVPIPRVVSPTFLFMKFPPRSTLPSVASMKARFGRFGPLDLSGARVYWGSYTCKLLFKYRVDAQAAYMYARNNPVFGPFKVNYSLRDADTPEPTKNDADDSVPSRRSDTVTTDINPSALKSQIQAQSVQLKSCLKKRNGDDTGSGSAVKETPRVKFLLDSKGGRSEPSVVARGNVTSSSSHPPKDLNGKNLKSVNFLPPQPPTHPTLGRNSDMPPPSQLPSRVPQESSDVDISYEMLNLLRRCSDIVTNVRSAFGYVPYHSL